VEVISISVDSHFVHKMWNDHELVKMVKGGVPFHMASDQAGNAGRAYGVWDESQGIELRGRFIIDPDGMIQAMEVLTPPVGRRLAESIRQIQAFQHVRASGGKEATPAGWEPGRITLKPGPDLVGKVWEVWKPTVEWRTHSQAEGSWKSLPQYEEVRCSGRCGATVLAQNQTRSLGPGMAQAEAEVGALAGPPTRGPAATVSAQSADTRSRTRPAFPVGKSPARNAVPR